MSTTPYTLIDTGAAPFTGTAAQTILASAAPDIDDTDPDDEFGFRVVCQILQATDATQSLHIDILLGGEVARRDTFLSIGSSSELRVLRSNYTIYVTDSTHALVLARPTLSAAGQNGNDIRSRGVAAQDVAFDVSGAIEVDFQVTLSADDAVDYVCTPIRIQGYKVYPTEASGAAVTGIKGDDEVTYRTGNVNMTAADIGAADADLLGYPVVYDTDDARPDATKVWWDTADQPVIGDSAVEGDYWITETEI
jgi:hypothetical protein